MTIRALVAALAGGTVMFFLGFLIYGLMLQDFMKENMIEYAGLIKEHPDEIPLILFNLVWGWFIAIIFDQWAGIRTFVSGMIGGGMIMFAVTLANDLSFLAFMNLHKGIAPVIIDIAAATVLGAVTGGVIALVLGAMSKETETTA